MAVFVAVFLTVATGRSSVPVFLATVLLDSLLLLLSGKILGNASRAVLSSYKLMWVYLSIVNFIVECLAKACTTLGLTPFLIRIVMAECPKLWKSAKGEV